MSNQQTDEFQRLYALLSSLSKPRTAAPTAPPPSSSASSASFATEQRMRHLVIDETTMEHTTLLPEMEHRVADTTIPAMHIVDATSEEEQKIICEGCTKPFYSTSHFMSHIATARACERIAAAEDKAEILRAPDKPLHVLAREIALSVIQASPEDPTRCRHCLTHFSTLCNFYRHFQYSVACNRLAYYDFKKEWSAAVDS